MGVEIVSTSKASGHGRVASVVGPPPVGQPAPIKHSLWTCVDILTQDGSEHVMFDAVGFPVHLEVIGTTLNFEKGKQYKLFAEEAP